MGYNGTWSHFQSYHLISAITKGWEVWAPRGQSRKGDLDPLCFCATWTAYRGVVLWSFGRCSTITEHITLVLRSLVTPESACNCIRCELRQPDACPCSCMDDRACNGQQIVCWNLRGRVARRSDCVGCNKLTVTLDRALLDQRL